MRAVGALAFIRNPKAPIAGRSGSRSWLRNQHGVVSLSQLRSLGVGKEAVRSRVGNGRLHRVHRGVYAVGHPGLSNEGLWMAAVLAIGLHAVLSHRAAAALWRLLPWRGGLVDVTVPGDGGASAGMASACIGPGFSYPAGVRAGTTSP